MSARRTSLTLEANCAPELNAWRVREERSEILEASFCIPIS